MGDLDINVEDSKARLKVLEKVDKNGNGTVSMSEFIRWFDQKNEDIETCKSVFARYDTNNSGDIDASELEAMLKTLDITVTKLEQEELLNRLDTDKSGQISQPEYLQWYTEVHVV